MGIGTHNVVEEVEKGNFDPRKKKLYDAIVVGSGAAGGMAAFNLASAGLKVLMLEAGRGINPYRDLKTTLSVSEKPYRGLAEPGEDTLNAAEYRMLDRPYGTAQKYGKSRKLASFVGRESAVRPFLADEREHPFTGTPFAWARARALGGKTLFWGRVSLRLSDLDLKSKSHDGFGEDWPISYKDLAPYYDRVDRLLGISGTKENLPHLPDGLFQRPVKLNCNEVLFKNAVAKLGRPVIPTRVGVTTDGLVSNKYRSKCTGRGGCDRGCNTGASFNSPTGLIYPAVDTGNLDVRPNTTVVEVSIDPKTNRATGVLIVDSVTKETFALEAKVVVLAASTLESTRILLNSKSRVYPKGLANSSGVLGHYLCEHIMGAQASGFIPSLKGREATLDDARPGAFYIPRFRNLTKGEKRKFIRGYGFQGGGGCMGSPLAVANQVGGHGIEFKRKVRELYPAQISIGGFGEVLARFENRVEVDPSVRDHLGIPVLRFDYKFGDNEKAMLTDMGNDAEEMLRTLKCENLEVRREPRVEGMSAHELGTARMGTDPRTSVVNPFGQTHDVKNLFVVDGSVFVSAGTQNPTWTILALAWRSTDYLIDQFKAGGTNVS